MIDNLPKDLIETVEKVISEKMGDPIKHGKYQTSKEDFLKGHDLHYKSLQGKPMVAVYIKKYEELQLIAGDGKNVKKKMSEKEAGDFFDFHSLSHTGNEYGEDKKSAQRH